ncbi:uncharacterized protein LOC135384968 [Ornithodoros turicata]|uniref:uncharacterized protein LOC135384968 n=1 Tax=Ornithodoros turicata TaxID=34597 RepID=UPI003139A413
MVERFHRHLEAALMARPVRSHWTDALPLVLLGVRSAFKADLGCSAPPRRILRRVKLALHPFRAPRSPPPRLRQPPTRAISSCKPYVPQQLATATHVFLHIDGVKPSPVPPLLASIPFCTALTKPSAYSTDGKRQSAWIGLSPPSWRMRTLPSRHSRTPQTSTVHLRPSTARPEHSKPSPGPIVPRCSQWGRRKRRLQPPDVEADETAAPPGAILTFWPAASIPHGRSVQSSLRTINCCPQLGILSFLQFVTVSKA